MRALHNLGIGVRLGLVFAVMILLLLAVGGYGTVNATRLAADLEASARTDLARIDLAAGLGHDADIVARASRELLLLDSAGPLKKQRALVAKALQDSDERLARLAAAGADPRTDALLAQVTQSKTRFAEAVAKYLETLDAGNPDDARQALLIQLRPVQAGYEQALQALTAAVIEGANARAAEGQRVARSSTWWLAALCAAGVAIAVFAAVTITRSIVKPLRKAIEAACRIEQGDLSCNIRPRHTDEVGQLLTAMHRMQTHLTQVIVDVNRAAQDVSTSSDEIAHGNADLSTRTERAAGSLQQTASAMEEISATVAGSRRTASAR